MKLSLTPRELRQIIARKFTKKDRRRQVNFTISPYLVVAVKAAAENLECPQYVVFEHAAQLGLDQLLDHCEDDLLRDHLQRHLLEDHLLLEVAEPEPKEVSQRLLRLRNALGFLGLMEYWVTPAEQADGMRRFSREVRKRKQPLWPTVDGGAEETDHAVG